MTFGKPHSSLAAYRAAGALRGRTGPTTPHILALRVMTNAGSWQCDTCRADNAADDPVCRVCSAPRSPGAAIASGPGPLRQILGWGLGLAIVAGLYFAYDYTTRLPSSRPDVTLTDPSSQDTTADGGAVGGDPEANRAWAVAASLNDLRAAIAAQGPNAAAAADELRVRETAAWESAQAANSIQAIVDYQAEWPDSSQQYAARARLQELLGALPVRTLSGQARATQNARLREAPVANARVLREITQGTTVRPTGIVSFGGRDWLVVAQGDGRGYVEASSFVRGDDRYAAGGNTPSAAPPRPPPARSPPNVGTGTRPRQTGPAPTPPTRPAPPPPAAAPANVTPAEMVTQPAPEYPERGRGETGVVRLRFTVTAEGRVRDIVVLSETPDNRGFGQVAEAAMRNVRYRPERRNGRPVQSTETLTLRIAPPN